MVKLGPMECICHLEIMSTLYLRLPMQVQSAILYSYASVVGAMEAYNTHHVCLSV